MQSLIIGLVFSLGVFAVKSGAGLSYLFRRQTGTTGRVVALAGYGASYGLAFVLAWLLADRIDFTARIEAIQLVARGGMTLHFLLALLLLVWGVALLKKREGRSGPSRGWLLLVLPCPVCFSVILFSYAFLHSLFPDSPLLITWLFAGFLGLSLFSGLAFALLIRGDPEQGLGRIMLLAALYFLVTVAAAPQFGDLERIYRVSGALITAADPRLPPVLVGLSLAFALGFVKTLWRSSWT